jgi:PBSX family phage portal protein
MSEQAVSEVQPEANASNLRKVKALAFPVMKEVEPAPPEASKAEEHWKDLLGAERIISPPYELLKLALMPEYSSEMRPAVDSMVQNVVGYGWQLHVCKAFGDVEDSLEGKIDEEFERLDEFLRYGSHDGISLTETRRRLWFDKETTGNSYLEVIPNSQGVPQGYRHVPAYQMRIGKLDDEWTPYDDFRIIGKGDKRRIVRRPRKRRFRRFVQHFVTVGESKAVWFKELEDPRPISVRDGTVLKGSDAQNPSLMASPMIFNRIYSSRTPYGVPRYMGAFLALLGSREAESINFKTLRNNNIPSMMLLVSNGELTQGTINRINDFVRSNIQAQDNYSRFLVIEADPDAEDGGQVKIEAKELSAAQKTDAMFTEYDKTNADKTRRAWRLTPIHVGKSDDYTRATADTSRRLSEEQVFAPERTEDDHVWNRLLVRMGMLYHEFQTNSPNVTDDAHLIKVMAAAERSGGMTPRICRQILVDILGRTIPAMDDSVPLDVPYSLQMADAVKNKADPSVPGQQVTAEKAAGSLLEFRDQWLEALVRKERALSAGLMPGLRLDPGLAAQVATGTVEVFDLEEAAETSGRVFALVDDSHALAVLELGDPEPVEKGHRYEVVTCEAIEPTPYRSTADQTGSFLDDVEIG